MKIKFDYNNVESSTVEEVLTYFMNYVQRLKEEEGTENLFEIDFGSINLYLTLRDKQTGKALRISNGSDKDLEWIVRPKKMPRTTKKEVISNEKFTVYKN